MSVCQHCSGIGGYHERYCPTLHVATVYTNQATETEVS